jgi:hypothetical protein
MTAGTNWDDRGNRVLVASLVTLGALALTTGGFFSARYTVGQVGYAARLSGTPGVLRVSGCTHAQRADDVVCEGLFRPDDGKTAVSVTVEADLRAGESVPMQRTDSGAYREVGFVPAAGWLAVTFLGLLVLCSGLRLACLAFPRTRLRRADAVVSAALFALMTVCGLAAGLVALAQAVL